ncbi:MAG TPA: peptidoglycan DD-metalloendopeptidase family protein [Thermoanaerobaculia bacterium]|nr:peptidoglycan DD-metalloendopeptidase family protein [Thermoanaerobaculia bacterium]
MKWLARCLIAAAALILLGQAPPVTDADMDRIRGEISRLKQRLEDVHRQARNARQELEAADLELGIQTRELEIATQTRQRVDRERMDLERQIVELLARIDRQRGHLRTRLVALYRLGGLSYLRIFMSLDQRNDPSTAVSMLTFLVNHDARMIERFQATNRQLDARKAELAVRQQELAELERAIQQRRRAVAAAYAEKRRVLASLQAQESGSTQQLAELEEKARRLERLVDILSKQAAGMIPSSDVRTYRGTLAWPAEGEVTEHFGRQRNPKFSTYTMNNGVKIVAIPRAPVRAVFQGTVLFSQWFKGYGNLIILDHGNQIVSLYGNIVAPQVAVGDQVTTGQTIAGVGDSEDAGGGYLYFEIRQDNRPEDPQKWLR